MILRRRMEMANFSRFGDALPIEYSATFAPTHCFSLVWMNTVWFISPAALANLKIMLPDNGLTSI